MARRLAGLVAAAALAGASGAGAQERASLSLLPGWAEGPGARMAGLVFEVEDGWKTYWRAPGEAGVPPLFDWSGSSNLRAVEIAWPAPEIFDSFGVRTLGYGGSVTLPLRLTAVDPARPISLAVVVDYGVCADVCLLERAELALDIAPDAPERGAAAIRSALALTPLTAEEAGLVSADCALEGAGEFRRLTAALSFAAPAQEPAPLVVVEGPPGVWVAPAAARVENGAVRVEADAQFLEAGGWVSRDGFRFTLLGGPQAVEVEGCR